MLVLLHVPYLLMLDDTVALHWSIRVLGGIVERRQAHNPNVLGSKPALATFEDSILGQVVNTNCASLHLGV